MKVYITQINVNSVKKYPKTVFFKNYFMTMTTNLQTFILIMFNKSFIKLILRYFKTPKTSHVWFFFDKKRKSVEDKQVVCSICIISINYTMNCSTGSLRSHLVRSYNVTDNNYKKHNIYQSKSTPGEEYNCDEDNHQVLH